MEAYFNERCLGNLLRLTGLDAVNLRTIYSALKQYDINVCRISNDDLLLLLKLAGTLQGPGKDFRNLICSFFHPPYESDEVEQEQDTFLKHRWLYDGEPCYGLSLAVIMDSISVSVGDGVWNRAVIPVFCDEAQKNARNLYGEETVTANEEWLKSLLPVKPIMCSLTPDQKRLKVREDHGKDILEAFGKRINLSPYVYGVINSLPHNSEKRKFIHAVKPDGKVEIVLPWTDKGYGLVVQTTGRNMKETEVIAEILKKRYGKE